MEAKKPLSQLAREISANWSNVNYAARPYLDAMSQLDSVQDKFGYDDGKSVVLYFLANAGTWRGDTARKIKAELRGML
tara:strand:- start:933 stop:1166 length:234 start_codon:yes stop_codon:yes gene_type:complete